MHKFSSGCAAAALGLMIASYASSGARAMIIAVPAALGEVIHLAHPVQGVSYICRGGWRWRRCGGTAGPYLGYRDYRPYYAYSFYRPEPYYAYGYYQLKSYPAWWWGWRQPWWW